MLSDLARDHEIVRLILDWREKSKIKSTYLDTLGPLRRGDGRVHTTYNQTITATGRLSSSDPNLQNIPTRSELGRTVKTAFSAGEGSVFLAVDYSQIELRLLAHLSGDEHLVRAFNEGEDFHAETAARVFGVPVSEVTPDLRSRAKAVNLALCMVSSLRPVAVAAYLDGRGARHDRPLLRGLPGRAHVPRQRGGACQADRLRRDHVRPPSPHSGAQG